MTKRTAKGAATFGRLFRLGAFGEQPPGGRYPIQSDEQLLSLLAYRGMALTQLTTDPLRLGVTEAAAIASRQLDGAWPEDAVQAPMLDLDPPKAES